MALGIGEETRAAVRPSSLGHCWNLRSQTLNRLAERAVGRCVGLPAGAALDRTRGGQVSVWPAGGQPGARGFAASRILTDQPRKG
jgi:hypothetical protein